jgi:hypothetical protein
VLKESLGKSGEGAAELRKDRLLTRAALLPNHEGVLMALRDADSDEEALGG